MAPSRPPSGPKRPWYLFAALVGGWIYGAQALSEGYDTVAYFRGDHLDVHAVAEDVNDTTARESIIALAERWIAAKDGLRKREYPLGIASLLLGGAMILFSARSMAGREGARSALIQVVVVHAGVVLAWYWLASDDMRAFALFDEARQEALLRQAGASITPDLERLYRIAGRIAPAVAVGVQSVASALIVLALTRPRVRAFFESMPSQLGEG
jgi:hypothetical protein